MTGLNMYSFAFHKPFEGYGRMSIGIAEELLRRNADVRFYPQDVQGWTPVMRQHAVVPPDLSLTLGPGYIIRDVPGVQWAWSMHEDTVVHHSWVDNINQHAQVLLVPSVWCRDIFQDAGVTLPIRIVPGGINPSEFPTTHKPPTDDSYKFMVLVDRGIRKGWDIAWAAFQLAFGNDAEANVQLVFKGRENAWRNKDGDLEVRFLFDDSTRFKTWFEDVEVLTDVFDGADCYLAPSRAEGLGMQPREAAAYGMPTIVGNGTGLSDGIESYATRVIQGYSMMDTMINTDGNAHWWNWDRQELAAHMRWCYDNRHEAYRIAQNNRAWIHEHQSYSVAVDALEAVLQEFGYDIYSNDSIRHASGLRVIG